MQAITLRCRVCGRTVDAGPVYVCEECLGPLEAVVPDPPVRGPALRREILQGPPSLWRYEPLLPVAFDPSLELGAGLTPLIHARRLGTTLGLRRLLLKNDAANPTWSFKDRVVALGVGAARRFGFTTVACASTGNLANAVAAYAARTGLRACVFIPSDLEAGKIVLSAIYGATIVEIDGTYDDVNRLCAQIADEHQWAFLNVNLRPFYSDGAKTLGYEVAEQLGWMLPRHVVVPVASGNLLVKIARAFDECRRLDLVADGPTSIHGAQAQGCAPVVQAFEAGATTVRPVRPQTIARSLAIGAPADGMFALEAMRRTGGQAVAVTDEDIVDGVRLLAETEGLFTETAGGVTIAALRRLAAAGVFEPDDLVVAYLTGMGLKTQEAVREALPAPLRIPARLDAFKRTVLPTIEGEAVLSAGGG